MPDLLHVEDVFWIWTEPTGIAVYDFPFDGVLACRRPFRRPEQIEVVARIGAFSDYPAQFAELAQQGMKLVHTPEEHFRATQLPNWYPLIADLTPKSIWFDGTPDPKVIEAELGWPVFMKGVRQTSRHKRSLSIIDGPVALEAALEVYAQDKVLKWQGVVCRKLERLRPVEDPVPDRIPSSFEFRSFWWRGELVGFGRYWFEGRDYAATAEEQAAAVAVAGEAARKVKVPFLVVDVAQAVDGRWIVIECNDGQESGYAGVSPFGLWQKVVELERGRAPRP
jgi:hypothetical protein